jgi:hypothetical protein
MMVDGSAGDPLDPYGAMVDPHCVHEPDGMPPPKCGVEPRIDVAGVTGLVAGGRRARSRSLAYAGDEAAARALKRGNAGPEPHFGVSRINRPDVVAK